MKNIVCVAPALKAFDKESSANEYLQLHIIR